jgi:hypothetical protein
MYIISKTGKAGLETQSAWNQAKGLGLCESHLFHFQKG